MIMMCSNSANHPFLVWGVCFLWLVCVISIVWSSILLFFLGDLLIMIGTDLIVAIVLLTGIMMLPTNIFVMSSISGGKKINHKSKVLCCPLWLSIGSIILINCVGIVLCAYKMQHCKHTLYAQITNGLQDYRSVPKYKRFIDNLQWTLRCCGLNSYKDWFEYEWYDKIRDYEWDPREQQKFSDSGRSKTLTDSVPLSCCKSGSCIANYLLELGTRSISTKGCADVTTQILTIALIVHIAVFFCIILSEILILVSVWERNRKKSSMFGRSVNVRHIMSVKENFEETSASQQLNPDESDYDISDQRRAQHFKNIMGDEDENNYEDVISPRGSEKHKLWCDNE